MAKAAAARTTREVKVNETEIINRIRGLGFMAGVLERQSREPLCSKCISYAITVEESREALKDIQESLSSGNVREDFDQVLKEASGTILGVPVPSEPVKQRKEGNCQLPDKTCLVKKSRKLFLFFKEKK